MQHTCALAGIASPASLLGGRCGSSQFPGTRLDWARSRFSECGGPLPPLQVSPSPLRPRPATGARRAAVVADHSAGACMISREGLQNTVCCPNLAVLGICRHTNSCPPPRKPAYRSRAPFHTRTHASGSVGRAVSPCGRVATQAAEVVRGNYSGRQAPPGTAFGSFAFGVPGTCTTGCAALLRQTWACAVWFHVPRSTCLTQLACW